MQIPRPKLDMPYLLAVAGDYIGTVRMPRSMRPLMRDDGSSIHSKDVVLKRKDDEVLRSVCREALVCDDGAAWLCVYSNAEINVPVLRKRPGGDPEAAERGEEFPKVWIRTDRISLWDRVTGQRLVCE